MDSLPCLLLLCNHDWFSLPLPQWTAMLDLAEGPLRKAG